MPYRIAINGYGRIGRSILRAMLKRPDTNGLVLAAINEPADPEAIGLLTRYDSNHGRIDRPVSLQPDHLLVNGQPIQLLPGVDAAEAPWDDLGIDLVLECSGLYADRAAGQAHLDAGARRVLFSQPGTPDLGLTVIKGFNDNRVTPEHTLLSAGSCTTNCLIPALDVLQSRFGLVRGTATTLHSAMNDQPVSDTLNGNALRLGRAALNAMMPVDTALGRGIERLMPELAGRVDCLHIRVPTTAVSALDIAFEVEQPTSSMAVRAAFMDAAEGPWRDVLGACADPVSSVDFAGDPRSAIVDLTQIRVIDGHLVKLLCWFDNEWGFANRMIDLAIQLSRLKSAESTPSLSTLH